MTTKMVIPLSRTRHSVPRCGNERSSDSVNSTRHYQEELSSYQFKHLTSIFNNQVPDNDVFGSSSIPTAIPSRDDDAWSYRSGLGGGGGGGGTSSVCSHRSHGSTREDIHSKIESLNAKRRALRGITYSLESLNVKRRALRAITYSCLESSSSVNNNSYVAPAIPAPYTTATTTSAPYSNDAPLSTQSYSFLSSPSVYSPTSVMSLPHMSISEGSKYEGSFPWDSSLPTTVLPDKHSERPTEESVNSRLEGLEKLTLELLKQTEQMSIGGGGAAAATLNDNKKVAFKSDCNSVATNIVMDDRSVRNVDEQSEHDASRDSKKDKPLLDLPSVTVTSYPGAPVTLASLLGTSNSTANNEEKPLLDSHKVTLATLNDSAVMPSTPSFNSSLVINCDANITDNTANTPPNVITAIKTHPTKMFAMKVVSEKILEGYTMTRNHCPTCDMALLCRDTTSNNAIMFNADGSIDIASLNNRGPKEECVYCPVDKLRNLISPGVCRRVLAAKLLSGWVVGTSTTNRGSLYDSSQPHNLSSKDGKETTKITEGSQVSPILDAACLEIVREQGRGGVVQEFRICMDCGCPEMQLLRKGKSIMKCVVCDVMKHKLREEYPSSGNGPSIASGDARLTTGGTSVASVAEKSPSSSSLRVGSTSKKLPVLPKLSTLDVAGRPLPLQESSSSNAETVAVPAILDNAISLTQGQHLPSQAMGTMKKTPQTNPKSVAGTSAAVSIISDASCSLLQPPIVVVVNSLPKVSSISAATEPAVAVASDGGKSLTRAHTYTSLFPDLSKSTSILSTRDPSFSSCSPIKSDKHTPIDLGKIEDVAKIDFDKLRENIEAEFAKATISQQSYLEVKTLGGQPIEKVKSACDPILDQEIVKSPSITSGDSPPDPPISVRLANSQDKPKGTVINPPIEAPQGNIPPNDLTMLEEHLKAEIIKARRAQSMLEHGLQHRSNATISSAKSREEAKVDLDKMKKAQYTLEKIIKGIKAKMEDAEPTLLSHVDASDVLAATASRTTHSLSISQQEVDDRGNLKEYIPPPSYFSPNIPEIVVVYHIPEEGDPSVAAHSHHTKNLKRSERYVRTSISVLDCCDYSTANNHPDHRQDTDYDFGTIGTDDDNTVDYTLNTMDDSRLGHMSAMYEEDRHQTNEKNRGTRRGHVEDRSHSMPQSSVGKCLFSLFGCDNSDGDDYSMASRRGIVAEQQQHWQRQPHYERMGTHYQQQREPQSPIGRYHRPFRRDDSGERYLSNPSVGEDSDFGSMCRVGNVGIPKPPDRCSPSDDPRAANHHGMHSIDDSEPGLDEYDYVSTYHARQGSGTNPNKQLQRTPTPSNTPDWDSVDDGPNGESKFGNMRHAGGHGNSPNPQSGGRANSSLRLPPAYPRSHSAPTLPPPRHSVDYNSVQSDLTDLSNSINQRRVTFDSSKSRKDRKRMLGHQHQLRALTEEDGHSLEIIEGYGRDRHSVIKNTNMWKRTDLSYSMDGSQQY